MFFIGKPNTISFVDRGDPVTHDVGGGDFEKDNQWHDLDLSEIIPSGCIAIYIYVKFKCNSINKAWYLRKKGNSNFPNSLEDKSQVVGYDQCRCGWVFPDANGVIEYNLAAATWPLFSLTVRGWIV